LHQVEEEIQKREICQDHNRFLEITSRILCVFALEEVNETISEGVFQLKQLPVEHFVTLHPKNVTQITFRAYKRVGIWKGKETEHFLFVFIKDICWVDGFDNLTIVEVEFSDAERNNPMLEIFLVFGVQEISFLLFGLHFKINTFIFFSNKMLIRTKLEKFVFYQLEKA